METKMDLTPSGKPKLGYSYPSNQRRQGPAPLASFEDLPSDEQISPETDGDDNTLKDLSPDPEEFDHILSLDSREVLQQHQPSPLSSSNKKKKQKSEADDADEGTEERDHSPSRTITPTNNLTSPVSIQGWSSKTVTPTTIGPGSGFMGVGGAGDATPTGLTSSIESFNGSLARKSSDTLMVPGDESGGEKSPSPESRRKGSWTDIFFRGRSRSRSKSPIGSENSQKSPNCEETTAKNKQGFFSFLKVGRKSSTSSGPPQQPASQPQSSSSSTTNVFATMPSQENSNAKQLKSDNNTGKTGNNNNSTIQQQHTKGYHLSTTPRVSIVDTSKHEKVHEELTIPQDPDEPKESQQDIITIIEQVIQKQINDLNEDMRFDLSEHLLLGESTITTKTTENQDILASFSDSKQLPKPNLTRKLKSRSDTIDDECQSLPRNFKAKDIEPTRPVETVVATIEHNSEKGYSSGSDLEESSATFNAEAGKKLHYLKRQSSEASEKDFEAASLLTQDSIDYDESSGPNVQVLSPESEDRVNRENASRASARKRLEINTIPVDRPRSTTPINIAPLEAFLSTASPSPDPNLEKIRLSLPGDTFTSCARAKSPRKSNPQIWLDFCEKGLHTPNNSRRRKRHQAAAAMAAAIAIEKDVSPKDSSSAPSGLAITSTNDAFTPVTETPSQAVSPLTPITPLDFEDQWTPFGDNFNPYSFIRENLEKNERYKWSMECSKCDCLIGKLGNISSNGASGSATPIEDHLSPRGGESGDEQPLVSPIACSCDCHTSLSRNHNQSKQEGLFSISSDISSASSRVIQASSASSSKSSSVGEIEDKILT